jgi:RNA polymerase-interacting CarD/CdnL/TRCF family regulator
MDRLDEETMMADKVNRYALRDWIVHRNYGIGQITEIEGKPINGEMVECYKVEIRDGAYWIPTQPMENPRVRPVASSAALAKALKALQKPEPIEDADRKVWKQRIDETRINGGLMAISKMIRDLIVLGTMRKRNQTEEEAFGFFTECLLREWVACTGEDIEKARPKLDHYLQICRSQANEVQT